MCDKRRKMCNWTVTERDLAIFKRWQDGDKVRAIAFDESVSTQRIYEIITKVRLFRGEEVYKDPYDLRYLQSITPRTRKFLVKRGAKDIKELSVWVKNNRLTTIPGVGRPLKEKYLFSLMTLCARDVKKSKIRKLNQNLNKKMEEIKMKKIAKGLCLLLAVIACLSGVQPVSAKTKYTNTEKNLAYALACYQDSELLDPDSFKIRKISSVKYALNKDNYEGYEAWGILDDYKTIAWKVDYTASNAYGGNVRESVYVTSTWNYCSEEDFDFEEYTDKTNYANSIKSKSFVKKIKKLTSKYYKEF